MNISRSEQRTLHAMAQGGAIVLTRDAQGRLLSVACYTREGYLLTDCNLSVWRRLKKKGADLVARRRPVPDQSRGVWRACAARPDNRVEAAALVAKKGGTATLASALVLIPLIPAEGRPSLSSPALSKRKKPGSPPSRG